VKQIDLPLYKFYLIEGMTQEDLNELALERNNLSEEVYRLNNIINELRKMLEHKVEFHKNLDFYEDKELETQVYYNYVACLQDFNEIVEKYKLGK
jgi:hypothetical protein